MNNHNNTPIRGVCCIHHMILPTVKRPKVATRSCGARAGEPATVGSPAAVVDSVLDALTPYRVRHADMPLTPANVWMAMQGTPVRTDLAIR